MLVISYDIGRKDCDPEPPRHTDFRRPAPTQKTLDMFMAALVLFFAWLLYVALWGCLHVVTYLANYDYRKYLEESRARGFGGYDGGRPRRRRRY